ncbi:enoyl-CoA hydratase domain-containing protein 2, mitochondrial isoform X2 [Agelaius tricolor]|uniref:enoyl-CoA hydratase domain-containing protein 2, mitochondrial isoform X2 n=1 Tax=Agelaius tricolor TaxID=9191 RepID=UPI0039F26616
MQITSCLPQTWLHPAQEVPTPAKLLTVLFAVAPLFRTSRLLPRSPAVSGLPALPAPGGGRSPGGGARPVPVPAAAMAMLRLWRAVPAALRGARGRAGAAGAPRGAEVLLRAAGGGIAEILMNRPHARNSLGKVFVNELFSALEQLRFDEQVRVVVFKSQVKGVFCAGADLKERAKMDDAEVGEFVRRLRNLMDEIAALPVPTIAAIDGYALGGGLELALACDLRVAASSAKMGLIETTRGLLPGAGSCFYKETKY